MLVSCCRAGCIDFEQNKLKHKTKHVKNEFSQNNLSSLHLFHCLPPNIFPEAVLIFAFITKKVWMISSNNTHSDFIQYDLAYIETYESEAIVQKC